MNSSLRVLPISRARIEWSWVSRRARFGSLLLTRYGHPWVVVSPLPRKLRRLLDATDIRSVTYREAYIWLHRIARESHSEGAVIVEVPPRAVAIIPV